MDAARSFDDLCKCLSERSSILIGDATLIGRKYGMEPPNGSMAENQSFGPKDLKKIRGRGKSFDMKTAQPYLHLFDGKEVK